MNASVRQTDLATIAAVFVLIGSFIWIWEESFNGATGVFTVALIGTLLLGHVHRGDSLREVGFRLDTVGRASVFLIPLVAVVIASSVAIGNLAGTTRFPAASSGAASIAQAIAFGLAQQYVLLAFFDRRFAQLLPNSGLSLFATGAVFAFFHLPNPFLMAVTFIGGLVAAFVYRRAPNLWVIGIVHGVVSFFLYYSLSPDLTGGLRVGPGYWNR